MTFPIQRQSEAFSVFDDGALRFAKDYEQRELPKGLASLVSRGVGITAGLNNPRGITHEAVNTEHMDPSSHAYHQIYNYDGRSHDPVGTPRDVGFGGVEPTDYDERRHEQSYDLVDEDDESGYNWGPEPHRHEDEAFREEPPTHLPPLHMITDERYAPLAPEPPDYHEQFGPHMASFPEARLHIAEDGPTSGPALFTQTFSPKAPSAASMALGGDEEGAEKAFVGEHTPDTGRWVTAADVAAQPAQAWGNDWRPVYRYASHRHAMPLPEGYEYQYMPDSSSAEIRHQGTPGPVSTLRWYGDGEVRNIWTDPAHRQRGLATELFKMTQERHPDLHHSEELTPEGREWAKKQFGWDPDPPDSPFDAPDTEGSYELTDDDIQRYHDYAKKLEEERQAQWEEIKRLWADHGHEWKG